MSAEQPPGRRLGRRRRANVAGGRQHRHVVKVTPEEELRLLVLAGEQGVSVPRLLVESALAQQGETSAERRAAIAELFAVRRFLAAVSNNLNQVAKHANAGAGFPEDAAAVLAAVRRMVPRIEAAVEGLIEP
jgi:hypothetical protein